MLHSKFELLSKLKERLLQNVEIKANLKFFRREWQQHANWNDQYKFQFPILCTLQ